MPGSQIGQTATHIATIHGSIDALEALLSAGAKPDVQNDQGATPLHYAINADKNWRESCVLLLSKGANPLVRIACQRAVKPPPFQFTTLLPGVPAPPPVSSRLSVVVILLVCPVRAGQIRDKYGKMPYEFTDGGEMWTMLGGAQRRNRTAVVE